MQMAFTENKTTNSRFARIFSDEDCLALNLLKHQKEHKLLWQQNMLGNSYYVLSTYKIKIKSFTQRKNILQNYFDTVTQ